MGSSSGRNNSRIIEEEESVNESDDIKNNSHYPLQKNEK